ncbi:DUF4189 domain-containing protein [Lysobacter capsici]|uniref:DUF4189 domain-containing protein n=1 Tax=Lysobacter capsici TaxID=435897 RepID=UPI0012FD4604|nr:DUF4189 domain-containing protein [Lysobacter capsici]
MKTKLFVLMAALMFTGGVAACPPGTVPQQGVGWQGCAPVPGSAGSNNSGGRTTTPKPVWADQWGAFAIDVSTGIGVSKNMPNKRKAEKAALAQCKKKGGEHCKVKIAFYNQCAVIVSGDTGHNAASAASIERATELSMETCIKSGDSNCELYFSECSFPVRIR